MCFWCCKKINVKVFNLLSRTNETSHIKWHETCKCECRLNASVCNNKHLWNDDKCQCECKELIDKGVCDNHIHIYNFAEEIVNVNVINRVMLENI